MTPDARTIQHALLTHEQRAAEQRQADSYRVHCCMILLAGMALAVWHVYSITH